MSRTIKTKSGSEFFTNVNEERLIGEMCEKVGAKIFNYKLEDDAFCVKNNLPVKELPWYPPNGMAYSMTEEEALDTANKLKTLLDNPDISFAEFKSYFGADSTIEGFIEYINELSDTFKNSKGYKCL